jgi:hypothetical protein
MIIRSFEMLPLQGACILTILIKLSIQAGKKEQKQDENHPAFVKLII